MVEVASAVVAAAVEVAAALIAPTRVIARETIWWWPEIAPLTLRPGTVFRDIQTQCASGYFTPMELLDRLRGVLFRCEPNECKAPGAAGFAVFWNVNVNDLADFSKELAQLFVRCAKVEVPYEYLT